MEKPNQPILYTKDLKNSTRRIFLKSSVFCGAFCLLTGTGFTSLLPENIRHGYLKRKLRPVLDEDWWLIGPPPARGKNNIPVKMGKDGDPMNYESVDHHIFLAEDGQPEERGNQKGR